MKAACPTHHIAYDADTGCEDCKAIAREALALALEEPLWVANHAGFKVATLEEMKAAMDELLKQFPPCEHDYDFYSCICTRCGARRESLLRFEIPKDFKDCEDQPLVWRVHSV